MKGLRGSRILVVVIGLIVALGLAGLTAGLGPHKDLVCGSGDALDRLALRVGQRIGGGQIEGGSSGPSYCGGVPTDAAWLMAALVFVVILGIAVAGTSRRLRTRTARGTVTIWNGDEGWGVLASPGVPSEVWVHFSAIKASAGEYRRLVQGDLVEFEYRRVANQDGYSYVADSLVVIATRTAQTF